MSVRQAGSIVLLLIAAAGCAPSQPLPTSAESPSAEPQATGAAARESLPKAREKSAKAPSEWSASEILAQLLATYRQANSYQDQAVVRLAFRRNGQPVSMESPSSVTLVRPNKLAIAAYQAIVKIDGREFKAKIDDAETNNADGQFVIRPAQPELKLKELASDAVLYDVISGRARRQPIQLELLLESGGLDSAFAADVACRRVESGKHAGLGEDCR